MSEFFIGMLHSWIQKNLPLAPPSCSEHLPETALVKKHSLWFFVIKLLTFKVDQIEFRGVTSSLRKTARKRRGARSIELVQRSIIIDPLEILIT